MITYKIKVIFIFWIVERFFCKPWRHAVTLHRLFIADGIGKANAGRLALTAQPQARSVLKSRRWSCGRHRDAQLEIATGGSIDFHSAMPENRGVAAGVAVAIAAAKNAIG